jgi:hypothetical protein
MVAPVIRQFLGNIPDKVQPQNTFDTNIDAFLDWQTLQLVPDLVAFGTFASDTAAALVAANLPSLTGRALDAVRVNAAANGVEFADVTAAGWALLDDANAAAQRTTLGLGSAAQMTDVSNADLTVNPTGAARRGLVADAIAAAAASTDYGAIGTYAFLAKRGTGEVLAGTTYPGSDLVPAGVYVTSSIADNAVGTGSASALGVGSGALSGTWRAMGSFTFSSATNYTRATIFVRIS